MTVAFWNNSKAIGIHCSGNSLFLAVLQKKSKDRVEPLHLIEGKLPDAFDIHALKDVGARNGVAELIIDIVEENNINSRRACLALHHSAALVNRSPISLGGDSKQIREHLRWEAVTILDAEDQTLVMDFFSVTDWIFSVAVRKEVLGLYRDIAMRAKIRKVNVDVPHFGLYNAMDGVNLFSSSGAQILLYVADSEIFLVLVYNGEIIQIGTYARSAEDSISQPVEDGILSIVAGLDEPVEDIFCAGILLDNWIETLANKLGANAVILDPFMRTKESVSNCSKNNEMHSQFAIAIGLAKRELVS